MDSVVAYLRHIRYPIARTKLTNDLSKDRRGPSSDLKAGPQNTHHDLLPHCRGRLFHYERSILKSIRGSVTSPARVHRQTHGGGMVFAKGGASCAFRA